MWAAFAIGCGAGDSSSDDINMIKDESGLKYVDIVEGTGEPCRWGDTVLVHYTGRLKNGKKFDSSKDRGEPFSFPIGAGGIIKGWSIGIPGMKVGGKRKLVIPPDLAYGKNGSRPDIPPEAELTFEIELIAINEKGAAREEVMDPPAPEQLKSITGRKPAAPGELMEDKTGIKFAELEEGSGEACKWGDEVVVHYTGRLADGKKFDSSKDRGKPYPVELGAGKVIKGWDLGIPGMKVGGKRKLVLPPSYAYGASGYPPTIPPNAELTFEVELLDITQKAPTRRSSAPNKPGR